MTFWADVSAFQPPLDNSYPYPFAAFKLSESNDFADPHAAQNLAWSKAAVDSGRMVGFLGYHVFQGVDVASQVAKIKAVVGAPHRGFAVMIDCESWGGALTGDRSAALNQLVAALRGWLGGGRVVAYGNRYDLASLWPSRPADLPVIVASYGSQLLAEPGQIGQQYYGGVSNPAPAGFPSDCPPFGSNVDLNYSALSPAQLAARIGITATQPVNPSEDDMSAEDVHQGIRIALADGEVHNREVQILIEGIQKSGLASSIINGLKGSGVRASVAAPGKLAPVSPDQIDRLDAVLMTTAPPVVSKAFVLDIAERAAKTFVQAFAAVLVAAVVASQTDVSVFASLAFWQSTAAAAVAAGLASVGSLITSVLSGALTGSASASKTVAQSSVVIEKAAA